MNLFLKKTVYFFVYLVLFLSIFQLLISLRIYNKSVNGIDNWDSTANNNAELIFIGSSRCWVHFDPRFFEKEFHINTLNLGMNGHSELSAIQLRLENYLSKNKAPKYVVLSFDPFIKPGNQPNTKNNLIDKNNYARFAFMCRKENLDLINYFKFDIFEKYMPLYAIFKYRVALDCITLSKSNKYPEKFGLNDEKWNTLKYPISNEIKKYYIKDNEIDSLKLKLIELKEVCIKKNIKLLCIQTPVYEILNDEKLFQQSKNICKELNIKFLDANFDVINNDINNFYNSNHLNKNGVDKMNKLLKNDIELTNFLK